MAKKHGFLDEAWQDVVEAAEYYEARVEGLGDDLYAEVDQALDRINALPRSGSLWTADVLPREVRRVRLKKFPFSMVYVVEPRVVVMALAHDRRQPDFWLKRMKRIR